MYKVTVSKDDKIIFLKRFSTKKKVEQYKKEINKIGKSIAGESFLDYDFKIEKVES
jgi:hypothetical protein